jgi:hypothetical protein
MRRGDQLSKETAAGNGYLILLFDLSIGSDSVGLPHGACSTRVMHSRHSCGRSSDNTTTIYCRLPVDFAVLPYPQMKSGVISSTKLLGIDLFVNKITCSGLDLNPGD